MHLMNHKTLGGILLISGTTIGAGILALPLVTGITGFLPAILLFILYWIFFVFTALLMLEVTLWMDKDTNLISMAKQTLGFSGELLSWATFLFLLYALTTAYLAGSSCIILEFMSSVFGYNLPLWFGPIPLLLTFGFFVYRGARFVDVANRILMLGLMIAYCLTIYFLAPHVETDFLKYKNWNFLLISNSIVATSFGFHIIIPSLSTYMGRDAKELLKVILIGSFIPLIVYITWEWATLGTIPLEGTCSIMSGYQQGESISSILTNTFEKTFISSTIRIFAFFTIVTSFLGVSLSLRDFLADGFKIKKTTTGRVKLYLMTFIPALLILWTYPNSFIAALEFAGGFGVMILLGFLPALMVWRGRYSKNFKGKFQVPGGKFVLIAVMAISIFSVALEIANKLGYSLYPM